MHISARSDYAVQAMLAIAWHHGGPVKTAELAHMRNIPVSYLPSILADLRRARLLSGRTGIDGGYSLTRPVTEISVGDVMRAVEGMLASIRGGPPKSLRYNGAAGETAHVLAHAAHGHQCVARQHDAQRLDAGVSISGPAPARRRLRRRPARQPGRQAPRAPEPPRPCRCPETRTHCGSR